MIVVKKFSYGDLLMSCTLRRLGSRIERDGETQKPMLILTTENTGKLPIPGIAGVLRIGSDDNPERKFKRSSTSDATLLASRVVVTNE